MPPFKTVCRPCSLDTGRLNPETYRLFEAVEKRYNIRIEYTFPDAQETMDLVREKGMFSFYEDGHQECCRVRKVPPLGLPIHLGAGVLASWSARRLQFLRMSHL